MKFIAEQSTHGACHRREKRGRPYCGRAVAAAVLAACTSVRSASAGAVATDGSLGPAVALTGPRFVVPATLGKTSGVNLFHSLSALRLDTGDVVEFSGPPGIRNVVTRVTGGPAVIGGTLRSTIPGAAFLLVDPAGVAFAPGAKLDVGGSFAVTTADEVRFDDGRAFTAASSGGAVLSSAAPAAFGFLSAAPASVSVNGAVLRVSVGRSLAIVGGDVSLSASALRAGGGRVVAASVASPGGVALDPSAVQSPISLSSFATLGSVSLTNSSINSNGQQAGRVVIRGGQFRAVASSVNARSPAGGDMHGIDVKLTGGLVLDKSAIDTATAGAGRGGDVTITAARLDMTGSAIGTATSGAGAGGTLTVHTGAFSLSAGSVLAATAAGAGRGGDINVVVAGTVGLDGTATPSLFTGLVTEADDTRAGGGGGGDLTLSAQSLMLRAAAVGANSFGSGAGGNVALDIAGRAVIDGGGSGGKGVFAQTMSTGHGGNVSISAGAMAIRGMGGVDASTFGPGAGGDVAVHAAGPLVLSGGGAGVASRIAADSKPGLSAIGGPAGSVTVTAASLRITDAAVISSSTTGTGQGGDLTVNVGGPVTIDGSAAAAFTGLNVETEGRARSGGRGGNLTLTAQSLSLLGGNLSASTFGAGAGGDITVNVAGPAVVDSLGKARSGIAAETAFTGAGGSVRLTAGSLLVRNRAAISADTSGPGPAGTAFVTAGAGGMTVVSGGSVSGNTTSTGRGGDVSVVVLGPLVLDGTGDASDVTGISADSLAATTTGGAAGSVSVSAASLRVASGAFISSTTSGGGAGGGVNVSVGGLVVLDGVGDTTSNTAITADSNPNPVSLGGGPAGSVTLTAGELRVRRGAFISSDAFGTGRGGEVTVHVAGPLTINGLGDAADNTSISAFSLLAAPGSGAAGAVTVTAAALNLSAGAFISGETSGTGAGGDVTVTVPGAVVLDGTRMRGVTTGLTVATSFQGPGGGAGGNLTLHAGSLQMLAAMITGSTTGTGRGGDVRVEVAGAAAVDGGGLPGSGVSSNSQFSSAPGGGAGGNVHFSAGSLAVRGLGQLSASTASSGSGGEIRVSVPGEISLDGSAAPRGLTGIVALTTSPVTTGRGGDITIHAGSLSMRDGSIDANTFGLAPGGSVHVSVAGPAVLDGLGFVGGVGSQSDVFTSGPAGAAGSVDFSAASLLVRNDAVVSTDTFGTGPGGDVSISVSGVLTIDGRAAPGGFTGLGAGSHFPGAGGGAGGDVRVNAGSILLDSAFVQAFSAGGGRAGSVEVRASGLAALQDGAALVVAATVADGGTVVLDGGGGVTLNRSGISAQAGRNGGGATVRSPGVVYLRDSIILAKATQDGGSITIDPTLVVLDHSSLSADAVFGKGGAIAIAASDGLLRSNSSITFSSTFGVQGTLTVQTPDQDVAGALIALPASLLNSNLALEPTCKVEAANDESTFVITGAGGLAPEPGGWAAGFQVPPVIAGQGHPR